MSVILTTEDIIRHAEEIGIASYTKVRNFRIKQKFEALRADGVKYEDALYRLAESECLSESSIQVIVSDKSLNTKHGEAKRSKTTV